jgi:acetyltransferase
MSSFGLERLFAPRSLALVGGSPRPSPLGAKVLQNLLSGGFAGEIAVVNPKYPAIDGKNAHRDLASLPFVPDLMVIIAPAPSLPNIVTEAGRLGVAGP